MCSSSLPGGAISYTYVRIYTSVFLSPGQVDMHMLVILILMTAAYQHNTTIARASGFCEAWNTTSDAIPVEEQPVNTRIRIQCAEGYVRKAGTSSLFTCKDNNGDISWHNNPPLKCIRDPKKPPVTTETTTSTTERTEIKNPTFLGTSRPTTATGHISLTTTNEVVTTKTRRTTRQTTLKSTTKDAESFTTTNEITSTNSTSSNFTSRDYKTTTSSHTPSSSFTSIKGVNVCVNTSTVSEEIDKPEAITGYYTSTVVGVTSIIIICLAAVFLIWWRWRLRHRERDSPEAFYIPVQLVHLSTDQT